MASLLTIYTFLLNLLTINFWCFALLDFICVTVNEWLYIGTDSYLYNEVWVGKYLLVWSW